MTTTETVKGISYIQNNKDLPGWIRDHYSFSQLAQIKKIFPKIGLPNCSEECSFSNDEDLKQISASLIIEVGGSIRRIRANIMTTAYTPGSKLDQACTMLHSISEHLIYNSACLVVSENKKIELRFDRDFAMVDGTKFISKGEGFFKAHNKIREFIDKLETPYKLEPIENRENFKQYSANNMGDTKYSVVFSSVGEQGAWDIATMSMRGIASCQSWDKPQSRGLIGSIMSKSVGVVYITSGTKINSYGTKMIRRAVVRYAVNSQTKKPALLVDRLYPGDDKSAQKIIEDFLTKKTGLPCLFSIKDTDKWPSYQVPRDSNKIYDSLPSTDISYTDTSLSFMPHKKKGAQGLPDKFSDLLNQLIAADGDISEKVRDVLKCNLHSPGSHNLFSASFCSFVSKSIDLKYIHYSLPTLAEFAKKPVYFQEAKFLEIIRNALTIGKKDLKAKIKQRLMSNHYYERENPHISELTDIVYKAYLDELKKYYVKYISNKQ